MPISKFKNIGNLKGQIMMNDAVSVDEIEVYLGGLTAITDKHGFFEFKNVKEGTHYKANAGYYSFLYHDRCRGAFLF